MHKDKKSHFTHLIPPISWIFGTLFVVACASYGIKFFEHFHSITVGEDISKLPEFPWSEFFHTGIPLAVLVMELYVILKMVKESEEREHTISEFQELASRAHRSEYLLDIARSIHETEQEVCFTSASMEVSEASFGQRVIMEAVQAREKCGAYSHRGLIAYNQSALPGAIELTMRTGVKIKFCKAVAMSRFRFFVRDEHESILGIAEGKPDLASPKKTTQSTRIHSRMLASALKCKFEELWENGMELEAFLDELIAGANATSRAEIQSWFSSIKCATSDLDKTLANMSKIYKDLPAIGTVAANIPQGSTE